MSIHTKIEYRVDNAVKGKIGFNSAKADCIYYNARWHREALIQLSLRSDVLRILSHAGSRNHPKDVHLRLVSRSGHSVLALVEQTVRCDEEIYPARLPAELGRGEVRSEPIRSNAAMIWRCRNSMISLSNRMTVLEIINQNRGISLQLISAAFKPDDADVMEVICRLICDGLVSIDLSRKITPYSPLFPGALLFEEGAFDYRSLAPDREKNASKE